MMTDNKEELFEFAADDNALTHNDDATTIYKVLSVEDDQTYQAALVHGLKDFRFEGATLHILTANSATQAANILASNRDISVILLDVVMEEDDAGLRLVSTIRDDLSNNETRIILLTGQPGFAPRQSVMQDYDINEYWQKSDLTAEKLRSVVVSNLRAWRAVHELEVARQGLQMLVSASRSLAAKTDLSLFCDTVLSEISRIIDATRGGIVCARHHLDDTQKNNHVIARSGSFNQYEQAKAFASEHLPKRLQALWHKALATRSHQFDTPYSTLYFDTSAVDGFCYMMAVESSQPLSAQHIKLLQVFSENVSSGFNNVALINRVSKLAYQDTSTELPNRTWLLRELRSMSIAEFKDHALLSIEVQNFSDLVLMGGEELSIHLIESLCQTIRHALPHIRLIARIRDNLVCVLLRRVEMPDTIDAIALTDLHLTLGKLELHVQTRIVAMDLLMLRHEQVDDALPLIDASLTIARQRQTSFLVLERRLRDEIVQRYKLLQDLNNALERGALFLMLQPKVHLKSGSVVGFEALIRWRDESGKFIPPDQFIPVAEAVGLIGKIDQQVFEMTISTAEQLYHLGYKLPVAFNVTCADLTTPQFVSSLLVAIERMSIPTNMLALEITESQTVADYEQVNPILSKLIKLGVSVNIDDFGTGYSSLAHITHLAATHLKIDRSFVDAMQRDNEGEHVVEMIIKLGKRFNFDIIAEGIETEQQRRMLIAKGCIFGQGYLFARPMPMSKLIPWLSLQPQFEQATV